LPVFFVVCIETFQWIKEIVMAKSKLLFVPQQGSESSCCGGAESTSTDDIREAVRERYGKAVKAVVRGAKSSCCGSSTAAGFGGTDPITRDLYAEDQTAGLPEDALKASFGCGNPTALAELKPGETVLDLGSGGGIDVLLSARRVGPTGKAYGLDMTDEMLELAGQNKAKAGVTNVEFLRGTIEAIPLPDHAVDVIISNCVINLSADKDKVLREAFRVLKSGGRFAVSDIVLRRELPEDLRKSLNLWTGCVAGALVEADYVAKLKAAGFQDVAVEATRIYTKDDAAEMASTSSCCGTDLGPVLAGLDGAVMSAFIRARKP
jgi:ubiquinone/menaquinone biosynthesis C-methylase UbiE